MDQILSLQQNFLRDYDRSQFAQYQFEQKVKKNPLDNNTRYDIGLEKKIQSSKRYSI